MTSLGATGNQRVTMKRASIGVLCCAVTAALISFPVSGAPLDCVFRGGGLALTFGNLDPSSNLDVRKPVTVSTALANEAGDCHPPAQPMAVEILDGASSRQMRNGGDTIAYTITGLPVTLSRPGNNSWAVWLQPGAVEGIIQWSAYANAPAGLYQDTITLVVTP
jgi:spore coat protein U-like protein